MCRAPTLGLSIFFGCHHLYKAPIWWNYSLIHLPHLPIPHIMSNIQHRCRCPCGAHNKIDIQPTPSQLNWYMAGNEINIKTPEDLKYQWKRFPKMALQHKQKRSASSRQNLREKSLNAWHGITWWSSIGFNICKTKQVCQWCTKFKEKRFSLAQVCSMVQADHMASTLAALGKRFLPLA